MLSVSLLLLSSKPLQKQLLLAVLQLSDLFYHFSALIAKLIYYVDLSLAKEASPMV